MAHSSIRVDLVIVVDYVTRQGMWTTPSLAARYCQQLSHREVVDEDHPDRKYWENILGPKPEIILPATDGFSDE